MMQIIVIMKFPFNILLEKINKYVKHLTSISADSGIYSYI